MNSCDTELIIHPFLEQHMTRMSLAGSLVVAILLLITAVSPAGAVRCYQCEPYFFHSKVITDQLMCCADATHCFVSLGNTKWFYFEVFLFFDFILNFPSFFLNLFIFKHHFVNQIVSLSISCLIFPTRLYAVWTDWLARQSSYKGISKSCCW